MKKAFIYTTLVATAIGAGAAAWYLYKKNELPHWLPIKKTIEDEEEIIVAPESSPVDETETVKDETVVEEQSIPPPAEVPTVSATESTDPADLEGLEARIAQIKEHMVQVEESGDKVALTELGYILAVSYLGGGQIKEALEQYEKALVLAHDSEHKSMEAACLIDLGSLKLQLGDFEGSIKCFLDGLIVGREFTRPEAESNARFQLAFAYVGAGRSADAIKTFEGVLEDMKDKETMLEERTSIHSALGSELLKAGEPAKAVPHLKESLAVMKRMSTNDNDLESVADIIFFLGSAYFALAKFKEAKATLEDLLPLMSDDEDAQKTSIISQLLLFARLALSSTFTADASAEKYLQRYQGLLSKVSVGDTDGTEEVAMREARVIASLAQSHSSSDLDPAAFIKSELGKRVEGVEGEARKAVLQTLGNSIE